MSDYMITQEEFDRGIRIKMPKKELQRWLRALESGRYIQGRNFLYDPEEGSFCCLGLEQYINRKCQVEVKAPNTDLFQGLPSTDYLDKHGIHFVAHMYKRWDGVIAKSQSPELYLDSAKGWVSADILNDEYDLSFKDLAALIRNHAVGY